MGEHDGHRKRMRERFLRHGLDSFHAHEVLELLLFYAQPRKNTNRLAHRLLKTFGTLDEVFDATPEDLMSVEDVGETTAVLIRLVSEIARRNAVVKAQAEKILRNSEDAGRYLLPQFIGRQDEVAYLVCLDAKKKVLDCRQVGSGTTMAMNLSIRHIVRIALSQNASGVFLAHNHPGGIALPSGEDVNVTQRLWEVLKTVGITLVDHLVVAEDDYVSMADSGYLPAE